MGERLLYTVGYEGADLGGFLATLKAHEIKQIIDVRDLPLSRKRGFSKNALTAALAEVGIGYVHLKSLGDPKPGRDAARSGNIAAFRRIYTRHLATDLAKAGLVAAASAARKTISSLLCYERDYIDCHRSIVAERLKADFKVQHIEVTSTVTKRRKIADDHATRSVAFG
jgi:uncharacterized protein (DUF488 family)